MNFIETINEAIQAHNKEMIALHIGYANKLNRLNGVIGEHEREIHKLKADIGNVSLDSLRQQAEAWQAVWEALNKTGVDISLGSRARQLIMLSQP